MKYSPFVHRNVYNNSGSPFYEDHPRMLQPFNIRLDLMLSEFSIHPNISTIRYSKKAPWRLPIVKFCRDLTLLKKAEYSDSYIRNMFLEHFSEHGNCTPIFTDGSKSEEGVGFAVVYPDKIEKRRLPNETSIFSSELYAILLALKRIFTMPQEHFVIVSDSQSALMAIETYNSSHPIVIEIQEWLFLNLNTHKNVQFCWVPSHVGVPLNEIVDKEAKAAIRERSISNRALPFRDYYPIIEEKLKGKWQQNWSSLSGTNKLKRIKSTISQWPTSFQRNRRWEVVLARLRLGHTRLTHRFLMEKTAPPLCRSCNVRLTVEHVLIECRMYSAKRNIWFRHIIRQGQTISLKSLLQESNYFNLSKIIGFLTETDILHQI